MPYDSGHTILVWLAGLQCTSVAYHSFAGSSHKRHVEGHVEGHVVRKNISRFPAVLQPLHRVNLLKRKSFPF